LERVGISSASFVEIAGSSLIAAASLNTEETCSATHATERTLDPKVTDSESDRARSAWTTEKNYTTNKIEDHQAKAYVAPKAALAELQQNGDSKSPSPAPPIARAVTPSRQSPNGTAKPKSFPKWGGAEVCPRCEKSVFIAELMRGAGQAWHKGCFLCVLCSKRIDSSNMCERDSEIYCRACYGKNFGPKGFGYGIGAGTLQMT